jgi:protein phosphatase-4 regulatory subunit 3
MRLVSAAIFSSIIDHDPDLVRSSVLSQLRLKKPDIVSLLISRFLVEQDSGLKAQFAEMLQTIVDNARNDTLGGQPIISPMVVVDTGDMDDFLNRFYDDVLPKLMEPLTNLCESEAGIEGKTGALRLGMDESDTLNR